MRKLMKYLLKLLDGLVDRVLVVAGAIILVQFPQFYAQYLQRLGGHLDEARRVVAQYTQAASAQHLTLQEYINIHLTSGNQIFVSSGKLIVGFVERLKHLDSAFQALHDATPLTRCWVFFQEMDPMIVRQTWNQFTPGIPTTIEAMVYALTGLLLAWGIYQGVKNLFLLLFRKPAPPKPQSGGPTLPV